MTEAVAVETRKERPAGRSFLLDLIKALGCVLIVLHHMAFYGPMSDVVATRWPAPMQWLADHARLAVQAFLVCSGYLTAAGLAAKPVTGAARVLELSWQRYLRLSMPLLAALSVTVLVTESVRPDFAHTFLSATPEWSQVLAHVFMLQHVLGQEGLSAGVWYVAIDFQLYLMSLMLWTVSLQLGRSMHANTRAWCLGVFIAMTGLSLLYWNRHADLDRYGLYFFGAYGMGWLAWHARQSHWAAHLRVLMLVLCAIALWVDFRWRIATACAIAVLLALSPQRWHSAGGTRVLTEPIHRLARISYSVFVIHYAVMVAVSAWVAKRWPHSVGWNLTGMLAALTLSLLFGALLHRWTEQIKQDWPRWLVWVAVFVASTGLAHSQAR